MRPGLARSKGWGGQYWKRWLDSVILESGDGHDDREQSLESVVELPPSADDDRHARPAPSDEEEQGGRAESKLDLSREGPALKKEVKEESGAAEKSASQIRAAAVELVRQQKTAGTGGCTRLERLKMVEKLKMRSRGSATTVRYPRSCASWGSLGRDAVPFSPP